MITELLGYGQTRKRHRSTCPRRLIHLTIHQGGLTLGKLFLVDKRKIPLAFFHGLAELLAILDNARLEHISNQVITLTGTLTYSSEHRVAVVSLGNIVNQLHDKHSLSNTGTTEKTNLTTLHVRLEQVDHLDTGGKHLLVRRELIKLRSRTVDRISAFHVQFFHTINRLSDDIHHTALDLLSGRHQNWVACRDNFQSTLQAVGVVHGYATNCVLTDMLLHLDDQVTSVWAFHLQSFVNLRKHLLWILALGIEINVDNRTNNLRDTSVNL